MSRSSSPVSEGKLVVATSSLLLVTCGAEGKRAGTRRVIDDAASLATGERHACMVRRNGVVRAAWPLPTMRKIDVAEVEADRRR